MDINCIVIGVIAAVLALLGAVVVNKVRGE